jgi:hypothetical protein
LGLREITAGPAPWIEFLVFRRHIRTLHHLRSGCISGWTNFSPHLGQHMRDWVAENNVELADTAVYGLWLNTSEAQFRALRYFRLAGTDHPDHATQASLIHRYIS